MPLVLRRYWWHLLLLREVLHVVHLWDHITRIKHLLLLIEALCFIHLLLLLELLLLPSHWRHLFYYTLRSQNYYRLRELLYLSILWYSLILCLVLILELRLWRLIEIIIQLSPTIWRQCLCWERSLLRTCFNLSKLFLSSVFSIPYFMLNTLEFIF